MQAQSTPAACAHSGYVCTLCNAAHMLRASALARHLARPRTESAILASRKPAITGISSDHVGKAADIERASIPNNLQMLPRYMFLLHIHMQIVPCNLYTLPIYPVQKGLDSIEVSDSPRTEQQVRLRPASTPSTLLHDPRLSAVVGASAAPGHGAPAPQPLVGPHRHAHRRFPGHPVRRRRASPPLHHAMPPQSGPPCVHAWAIKMTASLLGALFVSRLTHVVQPRRAGTVSQVMQQAELRLSCAGPPACIGSPSSPTSMNGHMHRCCTLLQLAAAYAPS